ncbi:hypothetical protein BGZ57DRAFT_132772 [Hyaloscypha finlandica]|nr:hypothetical protein BGZ57DRAFT_132772 [Hyaloscypha finlandica]
MAIAVVTSCAQFVLGCILAPASGPRASCSPDFSHLQLQHQHKHQCQHQRCLKPAHHRPPTKTSFFHPFLSWCLLAARHSTKQRRHSPHIRSETQLPLPCLFYGIIVSRHSNKVFPAFEAIFILPCTSSNLISHTVSTVRSTVKKPSASRT